MTEWFENQDFWRVARPFMLGPAKEEAAPAEVAWMADVLELKPGARVLDLCCGSGRHSVELAKRGFGVTGMDISEEYLERARKRAEKLGVEVEFQRRNMNELDADGEFDAVINVFTSFGFFPQHEDNQDVLGRIARSLKPGGRFLLDTINRDWVLKNFRERTWDEQSGVYHLSESKFDPATDVMTTRWIFVHGEEVRQFELTHYVFSARQWAVMCEAAGLKPVRLFGDMRGEEFRFDSRRIVLVARKDS